MYRGCFVIDNTEAIDFLEQGETCCDICIDPEDGTLSFVNIADVPRTFFVTIKLPTDSTKSTTITDHAGFDMLAHNKTVWGLSYISLISIVHPRQILDVCTLKNHNMDQIDIQSDIQEYIVCDRQESDFFSLQIFPLSSASSPFLCTQSEGGVLTHFAHPSTYYAVDFCCDIGTPIIAVFDGYVVEIRNDSDSGSPQVNDLFHWNSIMIKSLDGNFLAEYVHVQKNSFNVSLGEKISAGQIICSSGDSGFCPEPHLHFQIQTDNQPGSHSIPIKWNGTSFKVGSFYP